VNGSPLQKVTTGSGPDSITLTLGTYDYLFLHWGGQNGGWEQLYYVGNSTGQFQFSAPPGGHPAVGGLSFYSFYNAQNIITVPEPSSLALGLIGVAGICFRRWSRK
jgi:hypothetical protein